MGIRLLSVCLALSFAAMPARAAEPFAALAARCAPAVHPQTLRALVAHESGFNPLSIAVNGPRARRVRVASAAEAVAIARKLIAAGESVDLGLGQINSANLEWLGLPLAAAFDPCKNLAAAARVLTDNYVRERRGAPSDQVALDRALSRYNTGSARRGIANGYVARVRGRAGAAIAQTEPAAPAPPAPAWDGFAQAQARRAQWDVFAAAEAKTEGGTWFRGGR